MQSPDVRLVTETALANAFASLPTATNFEAVYKPLNYGAVGDGVADDTAALSACFAAAAAAGGRVALAPVTYRTTAALTYSATNVRLEGAGAGKTIIKPDAVTYNALSLGDGAGNQVRPTGYARGFSIVGPTAAPTTGKAALVVNGLNQFEVDRVHVDNHDIGFDLINNCFGTQFTNIRGGFGGTLNVGVNLRVGVQSGSDITFVNPWVNGCIAGMHVAGGGGGYHVSGGQVTAGQGTAQSNDNAGAIVIGKDYLTGATGEATIDLYGVSFEGTNYAHCIRTFDLVKVNAHGVYFTPQEPSTPALQAVKATNAQNSTITLAAHVIGGYWSSPVLVTVAGDYDDFYFGETDPLCAGNQPTINGVQGYVKSLTEQSGIISSKFSVRRGGYLSVGSIRFADGTSQASAVNAVDASATTKGVLRLTNDLGGTAAAPTVPGLATKTNVRVNGAHVDQFDVDTTPVTATDIGAVPVALVDAKGDVLVGSADNVVGRLPVGADGQVLTADTASTLGIKWAAGGGTSSGIPASTVTTKGDLIAATGNGTVTRLPAGADGYLLAADSTKTTGLSFVPAPTGGGSGSTSVSSASLRGFKAWSGDPGAYGSTNALVSGTFYAVKMAADAGVLNRVATAIDVAGSSLTYFAMAVYDSSGTQIAGMASNTTLGSVVGYRSSALNATPTLTAGQIVYVGILAVGTGTMPSVRRMGNSNAVNSTLLFEGTSPYTAWASQSTIPASFTPGANPSTSFIPWLAIA